MRHWEQLLSPANDNDASQRRAACIFQGYLTEQQSIRTVCLSDRNLHHGTALLDSEIVLVFVSSISDSLTRSPCDSNMTAVPPVAGYEISFDHTLFSGCLIEAEMCLSSGRS